MNVTVPKHTGIQWVYSGSKAKARQQRVIAGTCSIVSGPQCFQGPTNKSCVLRGGTTTQISFALAFHLWMWSHSLAS